MQAQIGKSACDQCRYCTEFCPRFLLGYAVEPHQVMRSLGLHATGAAHWNEWATLCCSCGLCTLYACPEELFPKEACDDAKAELRKAGPRWTGPRRDALRPHPLRDGPAGAHRRPGEAARPHRLRPPRAALGRRGAARPRRGCRSSRAPASPPARW